MPRPTFSRLFSSPSVPVPLQARPSPRATHWSLFWILHVRIQRSNPLRKHALAYFIGRISMRVNKSASKRHNADTRRYNSALAWRVLYKPRFLPETLNKLCRSFYVSKSVFLRIQLFINLKTTFFTWKLIYLKTTFSVNIESFLNTFVCNFKKLYLNKIESKFK